MRPEHSKKILESLKKIHGWFSPEAAMLFAWIDEIQKANDICGDIFEIGCHHGKSTLCLGTMARCKEEKLGVCDLFGEQDDNVSGSGCGDLEIFYRNMASVAENGVEIRTFQKNSNMLSADEIGSNYRFFHIDGGHNCGEALFDLKLAADCVLEEGVIVVDDPFRPEWPGVTEAVIRFLDTHEQYCAIVIGFNKLILVRKDSSKLYLSEISQEEKRRFYGLGYPWHTKALPLNGYPLEIFYIPTHVQTSGLAFLMRRWYRNQGAAQNSVMRTLINIIKPHN